MTGVSVMWLKLRISRRLVTGKPLMVPSVVFPCRIDQNCNLLF